MPPLAFVITVHAAFSGAFAGELETRTAFQPTCTAVKKAYKEAGCCGASDAKTKPVDLGIYRAGCKSTIAGKGKSDPIVGGTLYVYDPAGTKKAWKSIDGKEYVDIAESSVAAGCVPKHKPHMVRPSPDGKHTAFTYTGDQDFVIFSNSQHKAMFCPTVDFLKPHVFGGATHDGAWYGSSSFLLLDMTGCVDGVCGGGVYRFNFDFDISGAMSSYAFDRALGMDGVKGARKTSATKPISLGNNPLSDTYKHLFFVTDAKGAGSIMDAKEMKWVKHFEEDKFGECSAGGLWVEPHPSDPQIVLAQYGTQGVGNSIGRSCIFKINVATLSMTRLATLADNTDAHGLQFCQPQGGDLTVINTNRQTATLDVIKYSTGEYLEKGYDLNSEVFNDVKASFFTEPGKRFGEKELSLAQTMKLQPDVVYLHDHVLYMAARGPKPVSAVKAQNVYENGHPGVMAIKLDKATCKPAADQTDAFALTTLERSPAITSDVHGAWGVMNGNKMEIWAVDQAGTGSVHSYSVYSACPAIGETAFHDDPPGDEH